MSEAVLGSSELLKREDRGSYFEQRIFAWSPFGTLLTSLLILALFAGAFLATMAIDGRPAFALANGALVVEDETRGALTLSLLVAAALGLQRYARVKDREDMIRNVANFRNGQASLSFFAVNGPSTPSILGATVFGLVFAVIAMTRFLPHPRVGSLTYFWFFTTTAVVSVLFARGVVMTRAGNRASRRFIDSELTIDLLRIDQLSMVGRSAARAALIWFAVSAITCLFFTSNGITVFALVLVLASIGLGVAIFVATMEHMHRRIHEAKAHELERVRTQIDNVRHDAHADAGVAQRLHGLIALEKRIADAPEWPFDQSTALRVGASALILTLPWFGQAVAGSLVERMGQVFH
jgi:hypothetical protein